MMGKNKLQIFVPVTKTTMTAPYDHGSPVPRHLLFGDDCPAPRHEGKKTIKRVDQKGMVNVHSNHHPQPNKHQKDQQITSGKDKFPVAGARATGVITTRVHRVS